MQALGTLLESIGDRPHVWETDDIVDVVNVLDDDDDDVVEDDCAGVYGDVENTMVHPSIYSLNQFCSRTGQQAVVEEIREDDIKEEEDVEEGNENEEDNGGGDGGTQVRGYGLLPPSRHG